MVGAVSFVEKPCGILFANHPGHCGTERTNIQICVVIFRPREHFECVRVQPEGKLTYELWQRRNFFVEEYFGYFCDKRLL